MKNTINAYTIFMQMFYSTGSELQTMQVFQRLIQECWH